MKLDYYLSLIFLLSGLGILGCFYKEQIPSIILWIIFALMNCFFIAAIIYFIQGISKIHRKKFEEKQNE